jgi:hypothetical protein
LLIINVLKIDTHGHHDHVDPTGAVAAHFKCPITLHDADLFLYNQSIEMSRSRGFPMSVDTPAPVFSSYFYILFYCIIILLFYSFILFCIYFNGFN